MPLQEAKIPGDLIGAIDIHDSLALSGTKGACSEVLLAMKKSNIKENPLVLRRQKKDNKGISMDLDQDQPIKRLNQLVIKMIRNYQKRL